MKTSPAYARLQSPASYSLKRGPSVYSFSQLVTEAGEQGAADVQPTAPGFGPTSNVSELPGQALPTYAYTLARPLKRRYTRINSYDSLSIVPDMDVDLDSASPASPSSPPSELCFDAWAETPSPLATLPAAATSLLASLHQPPQAAAATKDATLMETIVTALWDECATQQLFRYDLSACATKRVAGQLRFVAQLNEGRATKKRATEFKMDKVVQPFDSSKFHFNKAYVREVLFQFEARTGALNPDMMEDAGESVLCESTLCGASPNLVMINVSPIEYGHVLLVPRVADCIPQLVDPYTVEVALHFAKEAGSDAWRVGYNSLGAYATINHLHFQAYQLDAPFPCELCPTAPIPGLQRHCGPITLSRIVGFPVNGWVVKLARGVDEAEGLAQLAAVVGNACIRMQQLNVPHNLLIADSGRRVFVWPQCFGERQAAGLIPEHLLDLGVNPAAFEISGHILLKRQQDYDTISETLVCELLAHASLPEERFLELSAQCFGA